MRMSTVSGIPARLLREPGKVREIVRVEFFLYQFFLILLDLSLTYLAFKVSFYLRFYSGLPFFSDSIVAKVPYYTNFMLGVIPFWVLIFACLGLYSTQNLLGGTREYEILFNATTLGMFVIIALGFLFPSDLILARGWVILAWSIALLFLSVGRFTLRRVIYSFRKMGHFQTPALIVGANDEGLMLAEQLQNWRTAGVRVVGYVGKNPHKAIEAHVDFLGTIEDVDSVVDRYGISDIILINSALSQEEILALFRKFGTMKNVNLRMSSGLYEIITTGMRVKEEGLVPLVTINKVRMTGVDQIFKLLMDYVIVIPAIILLLPLFGLIALAVRLDSPGPIIYRRRVMGVNGRQFDAFKFRTMLVNGDEILKANPELMKEYLENYKLKVDPRITRLGNFLRKTSLDELPQLLNVLRNEMSLVGPRMITPEELTRYNQWDINLLTVKPGITGMWQVQGRSNVTYEERVKMDMFYIRNWTIWLDIQLLIQTVPAVLTHRGAY